MVLKREQNDKEDILDVIPKEPSSITGLGDYISNKLSNFIRWVKIFNPRANIVTNLSSSSYFLQPQYQNFKVS